MRKRSILCSIVASSDEVNSDRFQYPGASDEPVAGEPADISCLRNSFCSIQHMNKIIIRKSLRHLLNFCSEGPKEYVKYPVYVISHMKMTSIIQKKAHT